ncbi:MULTISPECIES: hypothetical protein [unclassified Serratia (in: enterobacteria)]|uniref:hypothetical protein n=1 Tax=unclassified Serratia (in: enterobacteria) TaxID=2647522 RepID=UPI000503B73E|nr:MULTISPECIES: hypothetical protein [unclassified Serratia (in: enterobacteria)]KFK94359.1 membrane protein [Serratia sp. Ag2]KFK99516.1 membrane protein [Serratia sp. Ag1]
MIPNYLTFIRFQDRRTVPFFYLLLFIVLGFYWRNNGYSVTHHDAWLISAILAITLFNIIYDLKAYWAYSYVIGRVDIDRFSGKTCLKFEAFLSRPIVISTMSVLVFWLIVKLSLLLPSALYSVLCLFLISPLFIYCVYRSVRPIYIKQVINAVPSVVKYSSLYRYVSDYILLSTAINLLSISPLKTNPDFSLSNGFFSAKLMIAMLILCAIVLAVNLIFVYLSKRYIFLGRMFLKEVDFNFSPALPFNSLYRIPFMVRMLFLSVIQFGWIAFVSIILALLNLAVPFEVYFSFCLLPLMGYCFLHVYWHWHNEFLMSCDMCFRYEEFKKRET